MAKTKSKASEKETLKQEKIEKVEVKKLLKDERTHKIAGSICILLSILLFIAFTSYLFTWDEDQDKVFQHGARLLIGTDAKISNLMGTFGAFISHFFIYKGFGIASYLLCSLFFVVGVNLFFGKKVFSIARNLKYIIVGLPLVSVTAAVIMQGNSFAWGGAVGDMTRDWMYNVVGKVGTIGIIGLSFLAYVIWRFNPSFKLPSKQNNEVAVNTMMVDTAIVATTPGTEEITNNLKGNSSKGNAGILTIPDQTEPVFDQDLKMVEKEPVQKPAKEKPVKEEIKMVDTPMEVVLPQPEKIVTQKK